MLAIADFLSSIPPVAKAVTALAGALGIGVTIGVTLMGFTGLPAKVDANTNAIRLNAAAVRSLARGDSLIVAEIERTQCLLTLDNPSELSPLEIRRACP